MIRLRRRSRQVVLTCAALVCAVAGTLASTSAPASARSGADVVHLDGVRVRLSAGTRQVVTVRHTHGYDARVTFWRWSGQRWEARLRTVHGRTGYGGLVVGVKRVQGTGTTPLGTYSMTTSFGNSRRPVGTHLPFHRVKAGDYWVEDNGSAYYNTLRNKAAGGFRWWLAPGSKNSSELLSSFPTQYRWAVVINFNRPHPVHHRGAGIFLHVNGDGATAGCVSAPRRFIRNTMQRLRVGLHPVIAIGR